MAIHVKTTKELKNNNYIVKMETLDWPTSDTDLISEFGEPTVEVGGTIPVAGDDPYVLPTKQSLIKSGFPVTQTFDGVAFANAQERADSWKIEVLARITTVMGLLRAKADTFTGETTNNV